MDQAANKIAIFAVSILALVIIGYIYAGDMPMGIAASTSIGDPLPPLVFIPGIKGSVLSDPQGRWCWLTWWQALGFSSPELSLPLHWEGNVQQSDALVPIAPLRTVAMRDIYASFLDWAVTSGRSVHPFAYDWRRDNLETVGKFVAFLETVSQQHGGARVQVVGHSMGGLISFVALNRRPDLVHSALFAGVPFGPHISFLEDMHVGTAAGLNSRILSPQVLFTFVSVYSLFPLEPSESALKDQDGNPIPHDWYSAKDWERRKLGIFAMIERAEVSREQRAHLRNALRQAREFRSLMVRSRKNSFQYPPIAVLASDTRQTLSAVVKGGRGAVRGWDFQEAPKEPGDGRVPFVRALPPQGVPYVVYKTDREHGDLLNDISLVSTILKHLCKTP